MCHKNKEYTMKKQGFTLIELMVVIVIMGILAAVAVPKLFGQIAKSKASEVATNASAYKTSQDAYAVGANALGDAVAIQYDIPTFKTGNSFQYTMKAASDNYAWQAEAKTGLNDCNSGATWVLKPTIDTKTGKVEYATTIANANGGNASNCEVLTPGFKLLGSN